MIYDSSKDYMTEKVLLIYDGTAPTDDEIISYCVKNYGFTPLSIVVEPENPGPFGYTNPGTVFCHPREGFFG